MANEKDKLIKDEVINVLEWIQWNDEMFEKFFTNKISAENVYNRYLDEMKK